jgi:hypothetical protein
LYEQNPEKTKQMMLFSSSGARSRGRLPATTLNGVASNIPIKR